MTTTSNEVLDLSSYSVDFENWLQVHISLHGKPMSTIHRKGAIYDLMAHQFHSVIFSKDSWLLIEEEPEVSNISCMLEPWVNGKRVPVGKTRKWMFTK
jgi:hypothetical protein